MVLIFKSNVDIFYFEFTTLCTKKCSGTFFSGILQNSKLYKFTTFLYFYIHGLNFKTKAICEFTKFLHIFWFFNTITKPLCEFIRVFPKKSFVLFKSTSKKNPFCEFATRLHQHFKKKSLHLIFQFFWIYNVIIHSSLT